MKFRQNHYAYSHNANNQKDKEEIRITRSKCVGWYVAVKSATHMHYTEVNKYIDFYKCHVSIDPRKY